jgi:hypothetical protein
MRASQRRARARYVCCLCFVPTCRPTWAHTDGLIGTWVRAGLCARRCRLRWWRWRGGRCGSSWTMATGLRCRARCCTRLARACALFPTTQTARWAHGRTLSFHWHTPGASCPCLAAALDLCCRTPRRFKCARRAASKVRSALSSRGVPTHARGPACHCQPNHCTPPRPPSACAVLAAALEAPGSGIELRRVAASALAGLAVDAAAKARRRMGVRRRQRARSTPDSLPWHGSGALGCCGQAAVKSSKRNTQQPRLTRRCP